MRRVTIGGLPGRGPTCGPGGRKGYSCAGIEKPAWATRSRDEVAARHRDRVRHGRIGDACGPLPWRVNAGPTRHPSPRVATPMTHGPSRDGGYRRAAGFPGILKGRGPDLGSSCGASDLITHGLPARPFATRVTAGNGAEVGLARAGLDDAMTIELICVAAESGDPIETRPQVDLITGSGIVNDRNFGQSDYPGQNVTMIEAEEIERFNREYAMDVSGDATRRNFVTRGYRLSDLIGTEFMIGEVRFLGVEMCEPCAVLGHNLATGDVRPKHVVRGFVHTGLRADALTSGTVRVGDPIEILE